MATSLLLYNRQSKSSSLCVNVLRYLYDFRVIHILPILALGLLPLIGISQKSFTEKMRTQIEKTILYETSIDYDLTPGFIVGIVDGSNFMVLSFGTRSVLSDDTISIDDIFELGSVTKVFTASLVAELDLLRQLSFNERFDSLLPAVYRNPQMTHYTIEDLLTHHSGLPRYPVFKSAVANPLESLPEYSLEDLLDFYAHCSSESSGQLMYSNVGYALIEPILYQSTGLRYDELLEKFILKKNNMTMTSLEPSKVTAPGYNLAVNEVSAMSFGVFNASGGLKSCMADMLRYARYALFDSPEKLWQSHGPGLGKHLGMGLGWHMIHQGAFSPIYVHTGRSIGHTAFIGLVPDTKTGVVILANSANGVDDLGVEILRMINKNWKRKN